MRLKVKYRNEYKILEFDADKVRAIDVLKSLGLSRDFAFVVKNGEIVWENEILNEKDDIKVVNAISGGAV